jgi:hypothetical protein
MTRRLGTAPSPRLPAATRTAPRSRNDHRCQSARLRTGTSARGQITKRLARGIEDTVASEIRRARRDGTSSLGHNSTSPIAEALAEHEAGSSRQQAEQRISRRRALALLAIGCQRTSHGIMWVTFGHLCPSGHIMPDHGCDRGAALLVLAPHDHLHIKQKRTMVRCPRRVVSTRSRRRVAGAADPRAVVPGVRAKGR